MEGLLQLTVSLSPSLFPPNLCLSFISLSPLSLSTSLSFISLSPLSLSTSQVSDVAFEEFNGVPGKSAFVGALKLAARISAQLAKPFMFEYAGGHVGNIQAPAGTSDTMVNIVRGILGFFQLTVKTTQNLYTVEEVGDQSTS